MNQPELASLRSLHDLEQPPSPKVWEQIILEWERGSLRDRMEVLVEQPSPTNWDDLIPNLPTRKRRPLFMATACLFLVIGIGYSFFKSPSPKIQIQSSALLAVVKGSTQSSPTPAVTEQNELPGAKETGTFNDSKSKKSSTQPEQDYLWLASKSGAPIRIHTRWSELSCCLSGETQAVDCHLQQQQWHRELETSNLGFHADPFWGLVELLGNAENPSTFSPILCP